MAAATAPRRPSPAASSSSSSAAALRAGGGRRKSGEDGRGGDGGGGETGPERSRACGQSGGRAPAPRQPPRSSLREGAPAARPMLSAVPTPLASRGVSPHAHTHTPSMPSPSRLPHRSEISVYAHKLPSGSSSLPSLDQSGLCCTCLPHGKPLPGQRKAAVQRAARVEATTHFSCNRLFQYQVRNSAIKGPKRKGPSNQLLNPDLSWFLFQRHCQALTLIQVR